MSLANGQTLTQIYTVTIKDSTGETLTQDIPVTITGTNDIPTIVSSSNGTPVLTEDLVAANLNLATAGTITFQDIDLIDTHTASFALKSSTSNAPLPGYINNTSQIGTFALTSGATGVSEVTTDTNNTATVGWSFTVADNDPVLQSLALGETLTQIYTVTITDNIGTSVTRDVTVTLVGTNDIPTIVSSSNDTPVLTEDLVAANLNLATAGTITFQDIDLIDTHTASFALKSSTSNAPLPGYINNTSQIGTFALTSGATGVSEVTTDTNNTATVGWSFKVADNDPVLQSLALGETLTQIYTVTITDNIGTSVTRDVTVTLVGTNDIPTIVSSSNDTPVLTEDLVAANLNLATAGTITFQDIDLIDTHTASFALKSSTSNAPLPGYINNTSQIGTFALTSGATGVSEVTTDTNNTATVGWSFTVADNDPVLQSLALGETLTQIYTVTITDNIGTSVTRDVTVTLVGTNDIPTITSATSDHIGGVTEDTNVVLVASDTITFRDVDLIDTHAASFVFTSSTSSAPLPGFANNISNIGVFALGAMDENNTDTINTASLGWTFVLDNSNAVLQSLAVGQTITQIYTVTVSDGHGGTVPQQVTVTITGTNDGPTITSAASDHAGGVTEDTNVVSGKLVASDTITFQDIDLIDSHTASYVLKSSTSSVGLPGFSNNTTYIGIFALAPVNEITTDIDNAASLGWTFTLDNDNPLLQSLAAGQTITQVYTVTVSDGHGGTVSQDVTITITGTDEYDPDHDMFAVDGITPLFPSVEATPPDYQQWQ